ncbi:MAG: hypothetical protein OQJ74_04525, partial [Ignavibacteriaceae bacterium]|nr:hypothetical protein [Ignavibacteriaceae bacterium]
MKKRKISTFYPILINLQRFPCLVVGGGQVAFRKIQSLLSYNVKITVLSPNICKPLKALIKKNKIKLIPKAYSKEYIK